jgi:hypothetical protein
MNLYLEMIAMAVLVVLYGLAWHDQPAHEPADSRHINRK